jgi:uncharacterized protein YbjQ (UPF0145 family)
VIVCTIEEIPGRKVGRVLGLVRGSTIRTRHVGKDIMAFFRGLVGGEVSEYTKLFAESREQALDRMIEEAEVLGADAILGIRFSSSEVMSGAAELLVYGTAIRFDDGPSADSVP